MNWIRRRNGGEFWTIDVAICCPGGGGLALLSFLLPWPQWAGHQSTTFSGFSASSPSGRMSGRLAEEVGEEGGVGERTLRVKLPLNGWADGRQDWDPCKHAVKQNAWGWDPVESSQSIIPCRRERVFGPSLASMQFSARAAAGCVWSANGARTVACAVLLPADASALFCCTSRTASRYGPRWPRTRSFPSV